MDELEIAWFAGLFEGEGSCGIYGPYPATATQRASYERAKAGLTSADADVIATVQRLTGVGTVNHARLSQKNPKHKDQFHWQVQNTADVLHVCNLIYGRLHSRRQEQMRPVIEWCEKRLANPTRRERNGLGQFDSASPSTPDVLASL